MGAVTKIQLRVIHGSCRGHVCVVKNKNRYACLIRDKSIQFADCYGVCVSTTTEANDASITTSILSGGSVPVLSGLGAVVFAVLCASNTLR
jgi:hypothetical protein